MLPISFVTRDFLHFRIALVLLAIASVMAGCGADDSSPGTDLSDAGPAACLPGEMPSEGGGCQPAGLPPDMPCPPGDTPQDGGGCQPAGVPPDACGQGFEADGQGGCNPILPEDPCPPGQMAVPGDAQCHEVAPCGNGDYGMIPVEATTQFVNGAYPGSDSDGTQAKPWKHIQEGIDYAQSEAIVAVAAGSYVEDLWIHSRPVRLWGRCPALVEVVGAGTKGATLEISHKPASHSEVHSLAITGPGAGILTGGSSEVIVDHAWIHDTGDAGIHAQPMPAPGAPTSITVRASLVEATKGFGMYVLGSDATIEATVVRATQPRSDGTRGRGISIENDLTTHRRATLTLRASLLEQNLDIGVFVLGSDATIEATVVRAVQPRSDGARGYGISIQDDPTTHERATLTLRTSLLERNHDVGLLVYGSDATIEATVVRATQPSGNGTGGVGIEFIEIKDAPKRATLTLRTSLLEQNHDVGVLVQGSDATIEATIVRSTQPLSDGTGGHGILIQDDGLTIQGVPTAREPTTLTLRTSLLEQNHDVGVLVYGSDATIEATVVRATQPDIEGKHGRGIAVEWNPMTQQSATLTLRTSLLEQNHEIGLFVLDADATIEATVVRATQSHSDGTGGDGIVVSSHGNPTTATITSTKVEANARAGISNFSAAVLLVSSTVQCNRIDLNGEDDEVKGQTFTFDGSKGNLCGCENPDPTCSVLSANLSPPDAISPIRP